MRLSISHILELLLRKRASEMVINFSRNKANFADITFATAQKLPSSFMQFGDFSRLVATATSLLFIICIIHSCTSENANVYLEEKYQNGVIKMTVFKANAKGQQLVKTYDEKGQLSSEYYIKDHKNDSIIKSYQSGILFKSCEIDETGKLQKCWFYHNNGKVSEEFTLKNDKREGWHICYDISGDTTICNYRVNGQTLYVRQKKRINSQTVWNETFLPLIEVDKDTTYFNERIVCKLDLPLPNDVFNTEGMKIRCMYSTDSVAFAHPDDFLNYQISVENSEEYSIPQRFEIKVHQPEKGLILCQVVKKIKGQYVLHQIAKKKVVFLKR